MRDVGGPWEWSNGNGSEWKHVGARGRGSIIRECSVCFAHLGVRVLTHHIPRLVEVVTHAVRKHGRQLVEVAEAIECVDLCGGGRREDCVNRGGVV